MQEIFEDDLDEALEDGMLNDFGETDVEDIFSYAR